VIVKNLDALLNDLPRVRVGVIGDFCVDVYWPMDYSASETSVETGRPTRPVRSQRYELGGAGTIVNNLLALGVGRIAAFGVVGDDPFAREMWRLMDLRRVERQAMLVQSENWDTPVYIKPIREDHEEDRIDFGNFNQLRDALATELLAHLARALPELDIVIVNQQIVRGIHTPFFQQALNQLLRQHPAQTFIVDCRHIPAAYDHCLHRLNDLEATRLCGGTHQPGDVIPLDETRAAAEQLYQRWRHPLFVSRGARGAHVVDDTGLHTVPGLHIINPVDPVGAGDAMLAGLGAALAAGRAPAEAATFGNFVAGVTVQKLFQTGTASPAEIRAIGTDPDYVYEPELADDPRKATRWRDTEIEIVQRLPDPVRITHAIFDHDGTISTLRQGWEQVMEPMMIQAILGAQYATADETLYARVVKRVREFIDKTTGIQTLVQMQGLTKLVREFRQVPEAEILDEVRYKKIYTDALSGLVQSRFAKLHRGELDVADFTMKKAPEFLQRLHAAGVKLYLASGTDVEDVIREAEALGYAPLFEGRIYGAVGDATKEAKRIVLDRILNDIGPANVKQVVAFGDGPVEIRETQKRGGLTVGIASEELQRFGLNPAKRSRLIRAGAHVIIPDYSQLPELLALLGIR
jgi:bifunctional ADP-heptose synthase (sugar kinase/adenylyltransferase)/phosphoglycolate phosphatase-like HAD superfamily hydrolase